MWLTFLIAKYFMQRYAIFHSHDKVLPVKYNSVIIDFNVKFCHYCIYRQFNHNTSNSYYLQKYIYGLYIPLPSIIIILIINRIRDLL